MDVQSGEIINFVLHIGYCHWGLPGGGLHRPQAFPGQTLAKGSDVHPHVGVRAEGQGAAAL